MKNATKPRILYLLKILFEETDETCGLTLPEIQGRLQDFGISSERKSLYRDFDALAEFGVEVGRIPSRPVRYYFANRLFEPAQMTLLVDAVQTSRSITKRNSASLIKKLKRLVSRNDARRIDARVHVAGRVKMQNESIFGTLDSVQRALAEKRDVSFSYLQYDVCKNLRDVPAHDGKERVKTPLFLIYSNENYYMLAYDEDAKDHLRSYRLDRMRNVMIRERSPKSHKAAPDFDIATYERQVIGMFNGKPQLVKLQVAEELVGSLIDIFGAEVECAPAKNVVEASKAMQGTRRWATMRVKVAPSSVFFGKVAQFGGDVRIVHPKKVVELYDEHLKKLVKAQKLAE